MVYDPPDPKIHRKSTYAALCPSPPKSAYIIHEWSHSNSCGSPSFSKDLANSSEGSLKVAKSGKPVNRWSGLWGSSSKVSKNVSKRHLCTAFIYDIVLSF